MAGESRRFIRCEPLGGLFSESRSMGLPAQFEPVALLFRETYYIPDSLMVRSRITGTLAQFAGGVIRTIDQRKATAALDAMEIRVRNKHEAEDRENGTQTD